VNLADVLLVVWTLGFASLGYYRGFVAQLLSLAGLAVGEIAGSWIAPKLLADNSPWVSLAGLAGALVGAVVVGSVAGAIAQTPRRFLLLRPGLRILDGAGGAAFGAVLGLALAWLVAVVALHQPGLGMRSAVRDSALLPRLLAAVPPDAVLVALNRFDPFPELPALADAQLPPPDPSVLESPGTRAAAASVVKVEGTACGVGAQGSGWVVRRNLVATNVHVIAGQEDTRVLTLDGQNLSARVVYVDAANDVALLAVDGLGAAPLAADARDRFPRSVALLGYPRNGPLTRVAATAGEPRNVIAPNAYGGHVRPRTVVPLRGDAGGGVQPGDSGGPIVDGRGGVVAMVFGGTQDGRGGYAVPVELVLRGAEARLRPVSSGPCLE
jgi:S1-C subfamily serine protease